MVRGMSDAPASFVTVEREIRAPRAQVFGIASIPARAADWLWAPAQSANPGVSRDMPDGSRQLVVRDGDKLRDWVREAEAPERVVLDSKYMPRRTDIARGRHLRYELSLEAAVGITKASLSLGFHEHSPTQVADQRKWRRHTEQCLARLAILAEPDEVDE
jgi:uncharacterized protein YndB with AHSA1/START domain